MVDTWYVHYRLVLKKLNPSSLERLVVDRKPSSCPGFQHRNLAGTVGCSSHPPFIFLEALNRSWPRGKGNVGDVHKVYWIEEQDGNPTLGPSTTQKKSTDHPEMHLEMLGRGFGNQTSPVPCLPLHLTRKHNKTIFVCIPGLKLGNVSPVTMCPYPNSLRWTYI
jgi:hypothetical protein